MKLASGLSCFHERKTIESLNERCPTQNEQKMKTKQQQEQQAELMCDEVKKQVNVKSEIEESKITDADIINLGIEEDWKGLISKGTKKQKKVKRSLYLNPRSEWSSMDLEDNLGKPIPVGILCNGGTITIPKTRKNKTMNSISLSNTCAFDSLIQIIGTSLCDSKKLKNEIDFMKDSNIFYLADILAQKNVTSKAYSIRTDILCEVFKSEVSGQLINRVNCETTILNMIQKLNLYSGTDETICSGCENKTKMRRNYLTTNSHLIQKGIKFLRESLFPTNQTKCISCNLNVVVNSSYDIIFIDIFTSKTNAEGFEIAPNMILDDIPKLLHINETTYFLRGVVEFQAPAFAASLGHFIAVARRCDDTWQVYNDLNKKVMSYSKTTCISVPLVIYSI